MRLSDARCVVVDCRFDLKQPHAGFAEYLSGHVPGARYAHLDKDLSRPPKPEEGRHPLPDRAVFAACLRGWGISDDSFVVAYDEGGGAVAARLWWMLKWLGHDRVAVLDGGLGAWKRDGLAVDTRMGAWTVGALEPADPLDARQVATGEILESVRRGARLLDARAAARFRGESEPIDPVAGHVPGALNLPFTELLGPDQKFRGPGELRAVFEARGAAEGDVLAMCGSGVTACHLLLGRAIAGLGPGALYTGSWSEWIRDPSRPVATGL